MIKSASEFAALRTSDKPEEQLRASAEEADSEVWLSVIASYPELRSWVALNKTVPIEILELLAADPDPQVRSTVASKRKITPALQQLLANDPDSSVRARVAYNAKVEPSILKLLAADSEPFVKEAALKQLHKLGVHW